MNISSEIFLTDDSNSSDFFFNNGTELELEISSLVGITIFLLGFPINSYVIWLIATGTGNGLAAELFSLNLSICEILVSLEPLAGLIRYKVESFWIMISFLQALAMTGRPLFQCVICVERYLAVVHPVTFLKYKPLKYRLICCVIVWVTGLSFSGICIVMVDLRLLVLYFTLFLVQFVFFISIKIFCYVAVLRALKQSGPGDRAREEENHMKRRAFYLILISTATLVIIYVPCTFILYVTLSSSDTPDILVSLGYVFFISAGLVQPLLFLNRVEKLPCINYR